MTEPTVLSSTVPHTSSLRPLTAGEEIDAQKPLSGLAALATPVTASKGALGRVVGKERSANGFWSP